MFKDNLTLKKLKKQILTINFFLESNFSKLKDLIVNIRKGKLSNSSRFFLIFAALFTLSLSYLSIPTFYNKNLVQSEIQNQILKKYNIKINFNEKLIYSLVPRPHFVSKRLSIIKDEKEIAIVENFKIFISLKNFLSKNKIITTDLVLDKADFNIYKKDIVFFKDLLKTEPNENKITIKNSNIFFKNKDDEVLFINKIFKSEFFYDSNNLKNSLISKNEIFNIPFKLIIKNDKFNKIVSTKFNSKKIRLNLENEIDYTEKDKNGLLDILFINKNTSFNYQIKKNSLKFNSNDNKKSYQGAIDFKPFYLFASFDYDGLSSKNLFKHDSILLDLIKSEIFKNANLNVNFEFNIKDITNIDELIIYFLKLE